MAEHESKSSPKPVFADSRNYGPILPRKWTFTMAYLWRCLKPIGVPMGAFTAAGSADLAPLLKIPSKNPMEQSLVRE